MATRRTAALYDVVLAEPPPPRRGPAPTTQRRGGRPRRSLPRRVVAPDSHRPHGTYVKYVVERCGCEPCRQANRSYERARQRAMARPDEMWMPYVPAGRARRHIQELASAGIGLKQVARVSGVSTGTLSKLVYGDGARRMPPSRRIRAETERRILAVGPVHVADGAKVDAGPTWALLDELIARGFTRTYLAAALGSRSATPALQLSRHQVRGRQARAVAELHRRLAGVSPPPRRKRWSR